VNPTIVCPRGCDVGFGPITNEFQALKGKGNDGIVLMTVTAECGGCGLLCDNEIAGPVEQLGITTGPHGRL
jgi:hypothetical protein